MDVKTTAPKTADPEKGVPARECTVSVPWMDEGIDDLVSRFGKSTCEDLLKGMLRIKLQGTIRQGLEANEKVEVLQALAQDWTPETVGPKVEKDPAAAISRNMRALDEQGRLALLRQLQEEGILPS